MFATSVSIHQIGTLEITVSSLDSLTIVERPRDITMGLTPQRMELAPSLKLREEVMHIKDHADTACGTLAKLKSIEVKEIVDFADRTKVNTQRVGETLPVAVCLMTQIIIKAPLFPYISEGKDQITRTNSLVNSCCHL